MYSFFFDRKSLTLLMIGTAASGILLFVGGVLVGLRINLPAPPPQAAEFQSLSGFEGRLAVDPSDDPPADPAIDKSSDVALNNPVSQPETAPVRSGKFVAGGAESPRPQRVATPTVRDPAPIGPPATARDPEPQAVAEIQQPPPRAEPNDAVAPVAPVARPAMAHHGHLVQVGAYGVAENAEKQLAIVLSEGFDGFIEPLRTDSGRTLNVVRFGSYATPQMALAGARQYETGAPGREAFVIPPK